MRRFEQGAGLLLALAACAAAAADAPAAGDRATLERGRALLAQYPCGSCHRIPGVPGADGRAGGMTAPLVDLARRSYIAGRVPMSADRLARWIVKPQDLAPGTTMPALGVAPAEAAAMAAYLMSLR